MDSRGRVSLVVGCVCETVTTVKVLSWMTAMRRAVRQRRQRRQGQGESSVRRCMCAIARRCGGRCRVCPAVLAYDFSYMNNNCERKVTFNDIQW